MNGPADFLQKWARFPALPRIFQVPERIRNTKPLVPPGTDLAIWQWEDDQGRPTAVVFQGDSNKPLWKYTFGSEAQRKQEIAETIRLRKKQLGEERPMTISDRVLARYVQALELGKSFFTKNLKYHHWRGYLSITDMTNAGKRGKRVRELHVSPDGRIGDNLVERVISDIVSDTSGMTYDQAKAHVEKLSPGPGNVVLNVTERELRGVDVEPMGTTIELSKKFPDETIVSITASPHEFRVTNSVVFGRPNGGNFRQDTLYWSASKKDGILFYGWIKDNVSKAANMTLEDLRRVWDQLGVKYDSH